jgi:hypothetical protein
MKANGYEYGGAYVPVTPRSWTEARCPIEKEELSCLLIFFCFVCFLLLP